jgi:N-acetylglucosamine malate deacetylase 1
MKKILILAPHTDDGELGAGGSIDRFIKEGNQVYYAAFSTAEQSLPADMPEDTLAKEVREATKVLGIPEDNLFVFGYEVRKLNYVRQETFCFKVKTTKMSSNFICKI